MSRQLPGILNGGSSKKIYFQLKFFFVEQEDKLKFIFIFLYLKKNSQQPCGLISRFLYILIMTFWSKIYYFNSTLDGNMRIVQRKHVERVKY